MRLVSKTRKEKGEGGGKEKLQGGEEAGQQVLTEKAWKHRAPVIRKAQSVFTVRSVSPEFKSLVISPTENVIIA